MLTALLVKETRLRWNSRSEETLPALSPNWFPKLPFYEISIIAPQQMLLHAGSKCQLKEEIYTRTTSPSETERPMNFGSLSVRIQAWRKLQFLHFGGWKGVPIIFSRRDLKIQISVHTESNILDLRLISPTLIKLLVFHYHHSVSCWSIHRWGNDLKLATNPWNT